MFSNTRTMTEGRPDSLGGISNKAFERDTASTPKESSNSSQTPASAKNGDDEVDLSIGIGSCRSKWLGQKISNMHFFVLFAGMCSLFTAISMGSTSSNLPYLKRQFQIDDNTAGNLGMGQALGTFFASLLLGFFGKNLHIPKAVAFAGLVNGIASMAPSFLQFAQPYHLPDFNAHDNSTAHGLCLSANSSLNHGGQTDQIVVESGDSAAYAVMMLTQVITGVAMPFGFVLIPIYIDNNTIKKEKSAFFIGMTTLFGEVSIPLGFVINYFVSRTPIDMQDTALDPKDPRFVAAWWLTFMTTGVCCIVASIPLLMFPRNLISKRQQEEALQNAVVTFAGGNIDDMELNIDGEEPESEVDLEMKRKPSVVLTTPKGTDRILVDSDPSSHARNEFSGQLSTPTLARRRGSRLSNLIMEDRIERRVSATGSLVFYQPKKTKPQKVKEVLRGTLASVVLLFKNPIFDLLIFETIMIALPMRGSMMFRPNYAFSEYSVGLDEVTLASGIMMAVSNILGVLVSSGVSAKITSQQGYVWWILVINVLSACISPLYFIFGCDNQVIYGLENNEYGRPVSNLSLACNCSQEAIALVCGSDNNTYLSACYAGCQVGDGLAFSDCTNGMTAIANECDPGCRKNFYVYFVTYGILQFFAEASWVPQQLLMLRSVDPSVRSLAMSIFVGFFFFQSIPAPKIFGKIYSELGCLLRTGDLCVLYNREIIRIFVNSLDTGVFVSMALLKTMMLCLLYYINKRKQKKAQAVKGAEPGKDKRLQENSRL